MAGAMRSAILAPKAELRTIVAPEPLSVDEIEWRVSGHIISGAAYLAPGWQKRHR